MLSHSFIAFAVLTAFSGAFALSAESPRAARAETGLERNQEIRDLEKLLEEKKINPPLVRSNAVASSILFAFSANDWNAGPAFTNNTRKTTITPGKNVGRVAVAFAHEKWSVLHPMQKIGSVFFLYFDLDRGTHQNLLANYGATLEYRFVVDGVWMADPLNPLRATRINGMEISQIDLHSALPPAVASPEIQAPRRATVSRLVNDDSARSTLAAIADQRQAATVTFNWVGDPGAEVYVAGSFNHYDPYQTPLAPGAADPRHPGKIVYSVSLRLLSGQYYYQFVINGENCLDPLNKRFALSPEGCDYSLLQIP